MNVHFDLARIGRNLPFASALPDLASALSAGACVVQAPPGTGKTTLVPPAVDEHVHQGSGGRVIVTQPRRIAVRAAARRLAQLSGDQLGQRVGFSVRGEAQVSAATVVEFVTPGLLLRRLLADPELDGVAAVVLDEVHERSLDTDLLLGMLAEVRTLRDDLLLVAMSATLDAPTFADLLAPTTAHGVAPLVDCPSALYPLEVAWAPPREPRTDARGVSRSFLQHVARCIVDQLDGGWTIPDADGVEEPADVLAFLPGVREVRDVADAVRAVAENVEVLELHGQVDPRDQDRITAGRAPGERRRVIVSTGLAESSLTVPGVGVVVDAGLAREPRRDAARGMSGLVTVACSRSAARQRAGRAARLGPGRVVRCYDEATFARMAEHVTPEITTSDLTEAALVLAAWGTPGGRGLNLPTRPPEVAMADAELVLTELGAVDAAERLTPLGSTLVRIPTDPRLGRALVEGATVVGADRAAETVALLGDDVRSSTADLSTTLRQQPDPVRRRVSREAERLRRVLGRHPEWNEALRDNRGMLSVPGEYVDGFMTALAYPEHVARRIDGSVYLLASGTRAALPIDSPLAHHEWLAVAKLSRSDGRAAQGTGAIIRLAAPLTRELAEHAAGALLVDEVRATWQDGRVAGRRVQALGAIEFSATPVKPSTVQARQAVAEALARDGLDVLAWSDTARNLRNRLAFCHQHLGEPWPDVSDAALLSRLDEWLGPELDRLARGTRSSTIELTDPLRRLLPWPDAARFEELAPERLAVPSGSRVRITYAEYDDAAAAPAVGVKLQECFGLTTTPRLAAGRVPVVFHLLSPAGRPLAITDDLASFWAGPYAGVRADMRGRYPKHPWPEDPSTHTPTARTKNRL